MTTLYKNRDILGTFLSGWRNQAIRSYINGKHVDLACGDNELAKSRENSIGVDIKNYGRVDVVQEDFSILPFESDSIDTVTIIAALNYIPNVEAVLTEIYRILKGDGSLILTLPNEKLMAHWLKWRDPTAFNLGISHQTVLNLLSNANLNLEHKSAFMLGLNRLYIAKKKQ